MSVRIYEISKQLDMDNKEVMEILRARGFEVKSASSTIDNISAEAFLEEFAAKTADAAAQDPVAAETGAQDDAVDAAGQAGEETAAAAPKPNFPAGAIVKTQADLQRERDEAAAARKREQEDEIAKRKAAQTADAAAAQSGTAPAVSVAKTPSMPSMPKPAPKAPAMPSMPAMPRPGAAPAQSPVHGAGQQAPRISMPSGPVVRTPGAPAQNEPSVRMVSPAPVPAVPPRVSPSQQQPAAAPVPAAPAPAAASAAPAAPAQDASAAAPKAPAMPSMPSMPTMPVMPAMPSMPSMPRKPAPVIPSREETKAAGTGEDAAAAGQDAAAAAPPASAAAPAAKVIQVKPPIVVRDFAGLIGLKPFRLISELMDMGIFASMNQTIEVETAEKLARAHGLQLEVRHRGEEQQAAVAAAAAKAKAAQVDEDDPKLLQPRPPVVCVLGHVDHGKTTLLDSIRKANVVSGEAGGITQHVGAYQVDQGGQKITFLDTPGHAAFSKMRERGANVTDVAILVVAADDGFMPQTDEALKFAQKANVPVVIAINKMDAKGANVDRVKQQLQERGIATEDWGGETLFGEVSALKGQGIENLLEQVLLQAEMLELRANPKCPAQGVVVESQVEPGRGSTATVIVQKGTLKVGDSIVCGPYYCKVRAMLDEHGNRVQSAPPATPVRLMGFSGAPEAGANFTSAKNEKEAKRQSEETAQQIRKDELSRQAQQPSGPQDLESLLSAIDSKANKVLKVVVKADVHGTVEAVVGMLEGIKSKKVSLEVIDSSVGLVSKNDIVLASSSAATVVAFNTKLDNGVQALAKHEDVHIIAHNIIYELVDQVKEAMAELLDPEYRENKLGAAEVRMVFPAAKGRAAGCMVTEGILKRDATARLLRKGEVVAQGRITTLKRFKDDVTEVRAGYECGVQIGGYSDYTQGDVIEAYEIVESRPGL